MGQPSQPVYIKALKFYKFKGLGDYSLDLQEINILVGSNNAGKSTILSVFRILDVGLRRARHVKPEPVPSPEGGTTLGHRIAASLVAVSLENIATDYNEDEVEVHVELSTGDRLILFFPDPQGCIFCWQTQGRELRTAAAFRATFALTLCVVPVIGPLEHEERLVRQETVTQSLQTHRACRHFRNYWHMFPEHWPRFEALVAQTWPGMKLYPPELDPASNLFTMFVQEERVPREVYWSGFGFQIWCQLLTHMVRAPEASLLIVDEPETYLHPEQQRQLMQVLRQLGPRLILATHSVEIMNSASLSELILVQKHASQGVRLSAQPQVQAASMTLSSVTHAQLADLARWRSVVCVEDARDHRLLRAFARVMGAHDVAAGRRICALWGVSVQQARCFALAAQRDERVALDVLVVRGRSTMDDEDVRVLKAQLRGVTGAQLHVLQERQLASSMLRPEALGRALHARLVADRSAHHELVTSAPRCVTWIRQQLDAITSPMREQTLAEHPGQGRDYHERGVLTAEADWFDSMWQDLELRLGFVCARQTLQRLQASAWEQLQARLTEEDFIEALRPEELPKGLKRLIARLAQLIA